MSGRKDEIRIGTFRVEVQTFQGPAWSRGAGRDVDDRSGVGLNAGSGAAG